MNSFTIRKLDESVAQLPKARAREQGLSVNQLVKRMIEQALGVRPTPSKHRSHFEKLLGSWTKRERAGFDKRVSDFKRVEAADWQ